MKKFTVVITHYNQMQYIETAIKSVLKQKYKNIELIISDDCSSQFDIKKIEQIINKNNKNEFEYKILQGKRNVGTVKNINNTLKQITGEFVLFFAADDKLVNNKVINNFIKEFKDDSKNIVTSQCILYDDRIKNRIGTYVDRKMAYKLNQKSAHVIYEKMAEGCFYGSGGTAYRTKIFQKYGKFSEKYKYVEDWAYWLYVLRSGEKIYYSDFETLCHRDGGISHSTYTKETIPPHVIGYYKDILNIYEIEIIPYLNIFTTKEKYRILSKYNETILYYTSFVPNLVEYLFRLDKIRVSDFKLKYYWKIKTLERMMKNFLLNNYIKKIEFLLKYNKVFVISIFLWLLTDILIINRLNINSNMLLLFYTCNLLIIYNVIYITKRIAAILK